MSIIYIKMYLRAWERNFETGQDQICSKNSWIVLQFLVSERFDITPYFWHSVLNLSSWNILNEMCTLFFIITHTHMHMHTHTDLHIVISLDLHTIVHTCPHSLGVHIADITRTLYCMPSHHGTVRKRIRDAEISLWGHGTSRVHWFIVSFSHQPWL